MEQLNWTYCPFKGLACAISQSPEPIGHSIKADGTEEWVIPAEAVDSSWKPELIKKGCEAYLVFSKAMGFEVAPWYGAIFTVNGDHTAVYEACPEHGPYVRISTWTQGKNIGARATLPPPDSGWEQLCGGNRTVVGLRPWDFATWLKDRGYKVAMLPALPDPTPDEMLAEVMEALQARSHGASPPPSTSAVDVEVRIAESRERISELSAKLMSSDAPDEAKQMVKAIEAALTPARSKYPS